MNTRGEKRIHITESGQTKKSDDSLHDEIPYTEVITEVKLSIDQIIKKPNTLSVQHNKALTKSN